MSRSSLHKAACSKVERQETAGLHAGACSSVRPAGQHAGRSGHMHTEGTQEPEPEREKGCLPMQGQAGL